MVGCRILCVAEKPSIARAVAGHLGGGHYQTVSSSDNRGFLNTDCGQESIPGNNFVKNYKFDYDFQSPWGHCEVIFTSVAGHLLSSDFPRQFANWNTCDPFRLFDAPVERSVDDRNKPISQNIERQARSCQILYIWTDCDREGENIGSEVREIARSANARMEVKRAHFSNIERAYVISLPPLCGLTGLIAISSKLQEIRSH